MNKPLEVGDIARGMLVEWDWTDDMARMAESLGVRPVGRVVTQDDLPAMSVTEGVLNIQCLDNPAWVLSPDTMLRKGREIRAVSGSDQQLPCMRR